MILAASAVLASAPAYAQRATESAAKSADDAFGTSVGNESLGLYSTSNARGFNPGQAGNVRIDGLYFDQQAQLNNRVAAGSTVRVGISAQAYAFPAPTGIADFRLRLPGEKQIVSTVAYVTGYGGLNTEVDAQIPIVSDKLSVGVGAGVQRYDSDFGVHGLQYTAGVIARWNPTDASEVVGFWSRLEGCNDPFQTLVLPGGAYTPKPYPIRTFFGQQWAKGECQETNIGTLARYFMSDTWTLRAGVFRSLQARPKMFVEFLTDTQPNGVGADRLMIAYGPQEYGSYSGDVRLSNTFDTNALRHRIDFALRGRDVHKIYGGDDTKSLGPGAVGVQVREPEPVFVHGPSSRDSSRQGTGGVSYDVIWAGVGELTAGLQKTFYHRTIERPAVALSESSASPFLYNVSASAFINKRLALYGSYTRGLEEFGSAPSRAVNRGEAAPAAITRQTDAGFRFALTPKLKFVAGVFDIRKPYFNLDTANVFRALGEARHRGVEMSLAGEVIPGLTVVGGIVYYQPRLSGEPIDRGVVAPIPVGPLPRSALLNLTYQPPSWHGFSVDTQINNYGPQVARSDNAYSVPGYTQITVGARYNFKLYESGASIRLQAFNIANTFTWGTYQTGSLYARPPRSIRATFAADF